jgi:hypothetical protein
METAAVHALQDDDVAARIDDAARDSDLGSRAFSMAVAIILRAPSWVRRLASAMYMESPVRGNCGPCSHHHQGRGAADDAAVARQTAIILGCEAIAALDRHGPLRHFS